MTKVCNIDNCDNLVTARGWCNTHYRRWLKHGDPHIRKSKANGEGTIIRGYLAFESKGKRKYAHVLIVENILGRTLKKKECIHHVDGNGLNNKTKNLVVCPSQAYHMLLHQRQRAYDACGDPNWRKCNCCYEYDDPINMYVRKNISYHTKCQNLYRRERYALKTEPKP